MPDNDKILLSELANRFLDSMNCIKVTGYKLKKEGIINNEATITKIKRGIQQPSRKMLNKYIECYTMINPVWLLTGKGDSITKQEDPERQAKEISISNSDIKEGEYCGTLVYDIDGTCGKEGRDITFTYDDVIGCVNLPEIKKDSKIITASGDSMEPVIYSGDRVVIREIFDWNDIFYGQIYMILMDEYRMIKYIRKYEEDENKYIILRSRNKEYDDMRFERSKIKRLFIIENILSVKTQI